MEVDELELTSAKSDEDMFADEDVSEHSSENIQGNGLATSSNSRSNQNNCLSLKEEDSTNKEVTCRGTPLNKLPKSSIKSPFPPVATGPHHSVLFQLPVREGEIPKPWPEKPRDVWDQNHVRMPHSSHSLYPVTPTELKKRWELVEQSLRTSIHTSHQLEAAILHYNSKYSDRWDFKAMHSFFSQALEELETEYFFAKVLPKMIDLALNLPNLVTNGIPLLASHTTGSISLTQQQISCLLANAFFCTFPRRNTGKKNSEYSNYPDINFNRLFSGDHAEAKGRINCLHEKLKCLINYFRRVTTKVPEGVVTYSRHHVPPNKLPTWNTQTARLPNLYVNDKGTIEDGGTGMLEIDFANKFVGGGVLSCGCVQEEIRFVTYPELILARLFTEVLDDTEALIVKGCERFNTYKGYSNDFEWAGNSEDSTPLDIYCRRSCTVVAIDALRFPNAKAQYTSDFINRELNKAYAGFSWGMNHGSEESVATGNWGCGAFRGDARLKALLQLMAAAGTGRHLAYFTFGDTQLRDSLADMHSFLVQRQVTVGDLWKLITSYSPTSYVHSLYDHIYQSVNTGAVPRPSSPRAFKKAKFQKKIDTKKSSESKLTPSKDITGHASLKLTGEEIDRALVDEDCVDSMEVVKPAEARTLSVQQDKDLCLKRLSSSWTNLNESKKDFNVSAPTDDVKLIQEKSEPDSGTNKQSIVTTNRKKKISDYFQSIPKR